MASSSSTFPILIHIDELNTQFILDWFGSVRFHRWLVSSVILASLTFALRTANQMLNVIKTYMLQNGILNPVTIAKCINIIHGECLAIPLSLVVLFVGAVGRVSPFPYQCCWFATRYTVWGKSMRGMKAQRLELPSSNRNKWAYTTWKMLAHWKIAFTIWLFMISKQILLLPRHRRHSISKNILWYFSPANFAGAR